MTLIKGGTLVSADGLRRADILIDGERIAAVEPQIQNLKSEIVNANGLLIFPGLIDVHTHLRQPGGEHKEDFYTGTCAALAGGVTTVFAMPNTSPALVDRESLDCAIGLAEQNAACDFGLYLGATNSNSQLKLQHPDLRECALKMYMGSSTGDLLVEDFAAQYEHFEHYPHERVIAVHAEHEPAVRYFAAHGLRRPPICAELEVARAVTLAERCNRRLHVCHVSTRREVEIIADAKSRGAPVTCEFSPHHLFLTADGGRQTTDDRQSSMLRKLSTHRPSSFFAMNPPLRSREDVEALWANLNVADCIATDHAPHTLEEKRGPHPPMGVPGLETMLPLLLTTAIEGRHPSTLAPHFPHSELASAQDASLRMQDIARLCCEGPAAAFNISRKGRIAPGFDADLTLVDPGDVWVIGERPLFTKCNWTPFAGWRVRGSVKKVFLRGQLAFDQGHIVAQKGSGKRVNM